LTNTFVCDKITLLLSKRGDRVEKNIPLNNETEITKIKAIVEEITARQLVIIKFIQNNHKITMKKIDKLQEYNEIDDMVNQVFETRIAAIEKNLQDIENKIA